MRFNRVAERIFPNPTTADHTRTKKKRKNLAGNLKCSKYLEGKKNHVVNWEEATVIDGEEERSRCWILEVVELGNEGAYNLSHAWNTVRGRGWGGEKAI